MCQPVNTTLPVNTEVRWKSATGAPRTGTVRRFHKYSSNPHRGYYEIVARPYGEREFHWACEVNLMTQTSHDLW